MGRLFLVLPFERIEVQFLAVVGERFFWQISIRRTGLAGSDR